MNIQGSINQLLVLGAAGIKSDKQLQEYRGLEKRETKLRKSLDTLAKSAGKEGMDPEQDINKVFDELVKVTNEKYKLSPSEGNYKKTFDIEEERLDFDEWYNQAEAGEKWDYSKWKKEAPERAAKAKEAAEAKSKAEVAAAKAQEDLINRQNERMRKDKSINFSSFIEGGLDG